MTTIATFFTNLEHCRVLSRRVVVVVVVGDAKEEGKVMTETSFTDLALMRLLLT